MYNLWTNMVVKFLFAFVENASVIERQLSMKRQLLMERPLPRRLPHNGYELITHEILILQILLLQRKVRQNLRSVSTLSSRTQSIF